MSCYVVLRQVISSYMVYDAGQWSAPGRLPPPGQFCFESLQVACYQPGQHFLEHEVILHDPCQTCITASYIPVGCMLPKTRQQIREHEEVPHSPC